MVLRLSYEPFESCLSASYVRRVSISSHINYRREHKAKRIQHVHRQKLWYRLWPHSRTGVFTGRTGTRSRTSRFHLAVVGLREMTGDPVRNFYVLTSAILCKPWWFGIKGHHYGVWRWREGHIDLMCRTFLYLHRIIHWWILGILPLEIFIYEFNFQGLRIILL